MEQTGEPNAAPARFVATEAREGPAFLRDPDLLARFLSATRDCVVLRDKEGRVVFWNRAAEELYGWTNAEARGQKADSLLRTKFPKPIAEIEAGLYSCGRWQGELVHTSRDDRIVLVRSCWSLEAAEDGTWAGILQVESDFTRCKGLEEELAEARGELERHAEERMSELETANEVLLESQARFQQIAEAIRDVFWLTNPWRTSITYVNPAYEKVWGRSCQSLYSDARSWLEGVHPEDRPRVRQFFAQPVSDAGYEQSYRVVRPDCSVRWVLDRGFPVQESGRATHRVVGIVQDITERKELEAEVLAISEREQHRLGQDLHDDLCQQLVGIEFLSKALQRQLNAQPEATKAGEIAHLIRAAIAYTRQLAKGLAPLELQAEGLMHGLQTMAARTTELFGVQCSFRCPSVVLVRDLTVGTHLYRIAQEAVTNSIKHGKATRIEIELTTNPQGGVLTVRDNGNGISETYGSTGMGLRIMNYRADMIGGTVSIRKDCSAGTIMVCTFALTQW
jgi:PAS domain S-box-containing protein